jgi:hypothetical protein
MKRKGRLFGAACFCALVLLWLLLVWFALPVDLDGLSLPALVSLHLGPPVSMAAAWFLGKRTWAWQTARKANQTKQVAAQEAQARREAERTQRQAALQQRRAYLECRGIFLALSRAPDWLAAPPPPCRLFMQDTEILPGTGGEAALAGGLLRLFQAAFLQSAAIAWLPVYVIPRRGPDPEAQLDGVRNAWRQAAALPGCFEGDPPLPDCRLLRHGERPLAARVMALFEEDPALPALCLLGMDSPLGEAPENGDLNRATAPGGKEGLRPGHAVTVVVLSRPGLLAREADETVLARQLADSFMPYWERERVSKTLDRVAASPSWGRLPWPLQADFCALKTFAALYRPESADWRDEGVPGNEQARRIQASIASAAINAALRDPPPADAVAEERKEPAPLKLGWLVHNSGGVESSVAADRLATVLRALGGLGCELNAAKRAGNLLVEHGDVGAAGSVLMLAEALIRAAQLQAPVLMLEFRHGAMDATLARPAPAPFPAHACLGDATPSPVFPPLHGCG